MLSCLPRRLPPGSCPSLKAVPFIFRHSRQQREHAPAQSGFRVETFRQGAEANAAPVEIENDLSRFQHRAAQPVEFPDDEHATVFERGKSLIQTGPRELRPGDTILKNPGAARRL